MTKYSRTVLLSYIEQAVPQAGRRKKRRYRKKPQGYPQPSLYNTIYTDHRLGIVKFGTQRL